MKNTRQALAVLLFALLAAVSLLFARDVLTVIVALLALVAVAQASAIYAAEQAK